MLQTLRIQPHRYVVEFLKLRNLSAMPDPKKRPRRATALKPITVTIEDTCHLMRLGQSSVFELLAEGALRSTKVAGRRLVFYESIEELLDREALPADSLGG
jgi:hypothetical protein